MSRCIRRVIRIRAEDSPNVQLALRERSEGRLPSGRVLVPGVLTWQEYEKRRAIWDPVRQCIGLDGEFYEGAEVLLFPSEWLNAAERRAADRPRQPSTERRYMGIDPGEGGDDSAWAIIDRVGLLHLLAVRTPNTAVVPNTTLALMKEWNISPSDVVFDRGGGGQEHADRLREKGHQVRTVAFGESLALDPKRGLVRMEDRMGIKEERYEYVNRRAQMYHDLSNLLDPDSDSGRIRFAIPARYPELRRQLAVFPKLVDEEGRYWLPPKNKKDINSKTKTLKEMIGCSPDEADALVLAVHGLLHERRAGSMARVM